MSGPKAQSPTKQASYRDGLEWIALNDEPGELDWEPVSGSISTILLADLFGLDPEVTAQQIVDLRKRMLRTKK